MNAMIFAFNGKTFQFSFRDVKKWMSMDDASSEIDMTDPEHVEAIFDMISFKKDFLSADEVDTIAKMDDKDFFKLFTPA